MKFYAYEEALQNKKKLKMNDFIDLCVIFFWNSSLLYDASMPLQRLFVFLFILHDKFYISESKQNERPSWMFHIFTKNGL